MDLKYRKFADIDLNDCFFDSLREDYTEFDDWFRKKSAAGSNALVYYENGVLLDFLYLKIEDEEITDVEPALQKAKRLKVGTFKIDSRGTRRGERFLKKIMDVAVYKNVDEVYVTIFPKHDKLTEMFKKYGFVEMAKKVHPGKEEESVFVKNMRIIVDDVLKDYPKIQPEEKNKYVLSIYPKFHTKMFPDSILNNEEHVKYDLIKDVSPTNSIHKIYLCYMTNVAQLKRGDLVAIYRTNDGLGSAFFRSVVTSVCTVEEIKAKNDFKNIDEFIRDTNQYSIFAEDELRKSYQRQDLFVIKMTYNIAFEKRVTRGYLIENVGISPAIYWGFFQLTDGQFNELLKKGETNENYIIHKT